MTPQMRDDGCWVGAGDGEPTRAALPLRLRAACLLCRISMGGGGWQNWQYTSTGWRCGPRPGWSPNLQKLNDVRKDIFVLKDSLADEPQLRPWRSAWALGPSFHGTRGMAGQLRAHDPLGAVLIWARSRGGFCATAHHQSLVFYTGFSQMLGASMYEATARPNPRSSSDGRRRSCGSPWPSTALAAWRVAAGVAPPLRPTPCCVVLSRRAIM